MSKKKPASLSAPSAVPVSFTLAPEVPTPLLVRVRTDALYPSPLNPRRHAAPDAELRDLAASIAAHDVIEPLVVRSRPLDATRIYEIVAGHRRWQAAQLCGRDGVPVLVREMTDTQLLEAALAENSHRASMHPLDEARALARLQELDPIYRDVEALAGKVGRSQTYVRDRLKLLRLAPVVLAALDADAITAKHAERIARLPLDQHRRALEACFGAIYSSEVDITKAVEGGKWGDLAPDLGPLDNLDDWIRDNAKADLADPVVQETLGLTDVQGMHAADEAAAEDFDPADAMVLQLSDETLGPRAAAELHLVSAEHWREVTERKGCVYARRGAVVHGGKLRSLRVCVERKCRVHFPKPKPATSGSDAKNAPTKKPSWQVEDEKREAERKAWDVDVKVLTPALVDYVTARKPKVTAKLLALALGRHAVAQITKEYGVKLSDATLGVFVALRSVGAYSRGQFTTTARALGFDAAKALKAAAPAKADAPAKKKAAK